MTDWEDYEIPDIILNPPPRYNHIENKFGVCGKKPNLKYGGYVHRIWVTHAYIHVVELEYTVGEYLRNYGKTEWYEDGLPSHDPYAAEMRAAVEQALDFYETYQDEFEEFRAYREWRVEQMKQRDDVVAADDIIDDSDGE